MFLEELDMLTERLLAVDDHEPGPFAYEARKVVMYPSLEWFAFTDALAKLIGCAVVFDGDECLAHGNHMNVEHMQRVHAVCYKTLRKVSLPAAVLITSGMHVEPVRNVNKEHRTKRHAAEKVERIVWAKYPELRNGDELLPHGGRYHLGGILPTQKAPG